MFSDRELVRRITTFLKNKRVDAGLTQKAVAEKFGYTTGQFVSNWERGLVMPPLSTVRKLAEIYNVGLDEIYKIICDETNRVIQRELYGTDGDPVDHELESQDAVADSSDSFNLKAQGSEFFSN